VLRFLPVLLMLVHGNKLDGWLFYVMIARQPASGIILR
jgi:hypothetical protein